MNDALPLNTSFPPIAANDARILILGSMPGVKSLEQQQYYAHPRNSFWPIICALFAIDQQCNYLQRCHYLIDNHIAVWDVISRCDRPGSLDQHIDLTSMIANNFTLFFHQHHHIRQILFNGTKAEQVFNRYVLPTLTEQQASISRLRLPSTSPAHAAMTFEQKLAVWKLAIID